MKLDENKLKTFLERGVENIYPNKEFVAKKIKEGEKLTMYLGIDPTGPLHIGHGISLLKLKQFQDLGHKVIILIGDFTARIGDPTGKDQARKPLTSEEVLENAKLYKEQISKILNFNGDNPVEIKFNSEWLSKMTFEEVLGGLSHLTVDQMLKRDMFQKRQEEGRPIYLHEFMYPFLQGIDSVYMEVDGEIGGNDQTFNMLVGRDLLKILKNKDKFVVAMRLLTDSTGKKMGKTEGNSVSLADSPDEMYGKIMSWRDEMIADALELCTTVSDDDVLKIKKDISSDNNKKQHKMFLAKKIVEIYFGERAAIEAENNFENIFSKKNIPEEILTVPRDSYLSNTLIKYGLVDSKSEFRRLLSDGAIKILGEEEIVLEEDLIPNKEIVLKVGKKRFIKIK